MRFHHAAMLGGLLLLPAVACGGGRTVPYEVLNAASEPLRSQFEADSGKVRAVFLASPT